MFSLPIGGTSVAAVGVFAYLLRLLTWVVYGLVIATFVTTSLFTLGRERDNTALSASVAELKTLASRNESDLRVVLGYSVRDAWDRLQTLGYLGIGAWVGSILAGIPEEFPDEGEPGQP